MTSNYYDIIIVGAGLSGLYSAFNIKKMYPNINLLILESNKKQYIGGRIGNHHFYDADIVIGAGVGRKNTDDLLIQLLDELNINYSPFNVTMNYSKIIKLSVDIKEYLYKLRQIYKQYENPPSVTFKKFAKEHLGKKLYDAFIISSGFSDYEEEDVYEVLYHYQMDDNAPNWTALEIPWSKLVSKLCDKIGRQNILASAKVEKINKVQSNPCLFTIETLLNQNIQKIFYANKVIVATRISTVQKLIPSLHIYKEIHGQPFLYIYAKFDKKSAELMSQLVPTYTVVNGPLQKMIPFSKSVYMIAYADNKNAELLQQHKENNAKNRHFFEIQVEKALGIDLNTLKILAITDYYWPIGTHYFEPLNVKKYKNRVDFIKQAQHPMTGMLVVGEAVSRRQGWTEGALTSVHSVLTKKWISTNDC